MHRLLLPIVAAPDIWLDCEIRQAGSVVDVGVSWFVAHLRTELNNR